MRTVRRLGVVLVVCTLVGVAGGQPPPVANFGGGQPPVLEIPTPVLESVPVAKQPAPTVDQLIEQLVAVRKEKAELEKREQAVIKALQDKLRDQKEKLDKLGILPGAPNEAPRIPETSLPVPAIK